MTPSLSQELGFNFFKILDSIVAYMGPFILGLK
jgi:hypothetical protein